MSQIFSSLDDLVVMGGQLAPMPPVASPLNPPAAPAQPVAPQQPSQQALAPVTNPASAPAIPATPAAPGAPAPAAPAEKVKKPRKPKAPAVVAPATVPDPALAFTPGHLSTVGAPGMAGPIVSAGVSTFQVQPSTFQPNTPAPAVQGQVDFAAVTNGALTAQAFVPAAPAAAYVGPLEDDGVSDADGEEVAEEIDDLFDVDPAGIDYAAVQEASAVGQAVNQPFALTGPAAPAVTKQVAQVATPAAAPIKPVNSSMPPMPSQAVADPADEVQALQLQRDRIAQEMAQSDALTGLRALRNKNEWDKQSIVEEAYHMMRWEPNRMFTLAPQRLCEYEMAIAANHAFVQSEEGRWKALYDHLGREFDRVMFIRRESQKGDTKTEKENNLIAVDITIRKFRNDYIVAKAMATYLEKMGEATAVVANGIKRSITFRVEEMKMSGQTTRHTP